MMNIEQYQVEYDNLKASIKVIEKEVEKLKETAKKDGYVIKGNKFQPNEMKLTAFWKGTYYSHFDGHISEAVEYSFGGSVRLNDDNVKAFQELLLIISKYKSLWEVKRSSDFPIVDKLIDQILDLEEGPYEILACNIGEFESRYSIKTGPDYLKIFKDGEEEQGEITPGSYFEIKMASLDQMTKIYEDD